MKYLDIHYKEKLRMREKEWTFKFCSDKKNVFLCDNKWIQLLDVILNNNTMQISLL